MHYLDRCSDEKKAAMTQRLIAIHARDGGRITEYASFRCPRCGERPMLFIGNTEWNDGLPVIECICLAPFSPKPKLVEAHPELLRMWGLPDTQNAEAWGLFVQQKLLLPDPDDAEFFGEEDDEASDNE
jgi:hypothetical protein